jgi:hypothetical protein
MPKSFRKSFQTISAGDAIVVSVTGGLFIACCDCNLVHAINIEPVDDGSAVIIRMYRDQRRTSALRRHRGINIMRKQAERKY